MENKTKVKVDKDLLHQVYGKSVGEFLGNPAQKTDKQDNTFAREELIAT